MKITKDDLCAIVTEHFDGECRVCFDIVPTPKKRPAHYVLKMKAREKKAVQK